MTAPANKIFVFDPSVKHMNEWISELLLSESTKKSLHSLNNSRFVTPVQYLNSGLNVRIDHYKPETYSSYIEKPKPQMLAEFRHRTCSMCYRPYMSRNVEVGQHVCGVCDKYWNAF